MSDLDTLLAQTMADYNKLLLVLADTLDKLIDNQERQIKLLKSELKKTKEMATQYER